MKTLVIGNKKGGVGKSTISTNLAGALADLGLNVLYIDTDDQGSTSRFFGNDDTGTGLVEFVTKQDLGVIVSTDISKELKGRIDLIVNNDPNNLALKQFLQSSLSNVFELAKTIKQVKPKYDVIVIDTKGVDGRGEIKEAAMIAADIVLAPVTPSGLDIADLDHNIEIFRNSTLAFDNMGLTTVPPSMKIVLNQVDQTNLTKDITSYLSDTYNGPDSNGVPVSLLNTQIRRLLVYRDFYTKGEFAHRMTESASATMLSLIHEIFPEFNDRQF